MGPVIQSLLRLQEIETQLWALRDALTAKNHAVNAQQRKIQQLQQQTQQKLDQLKHARADADSQELDIKAQESEIGKLRNALNTARTNKEYNAILSQINSDRAEIARQEERGLALLTQIDQMDAECRQAQKQIAQAQDRLDALRRDQQDAQAQSRQDLDKLEQAKATVADSIPASVLDQFQRIGQSFNGQAMAAVTQPDHRGSAYCCSGCYMSITIDTVDVLMSKDEIKQCPNCQRLLYIPPEEP
ncbi:MAG: hypothetical protein KAT11_02735 [Phycisphaerae bacterium]|nr:hypothetical protein [Phycisphaerae bacterium]